MAAMSNDTRPDLGAGLVLAVVSAASFGMSGSLARGLLDAGWSAGAVVLARLAIAALVVVPVAAHALRGRWGALRENIGLILLFGAVPVAGTQFAFFSAVQRMDVGPALLIEYTAPAAVVVWLWLRHGERPGPLTVAGAGLAALGLVLVLDLLSGADLAPVGVLWALIAMAGVASYFVLAANPRSTLPPVALAGAGMASGALMLAVVGAVGILPMHATTASPLYAGTAVTWWIPLLGLGVVTAGIAYCDRDRREPAARLAPGLVRRAARDRVRRGVRVAAAGPDPGRPATRRRHADRRRGRRGQARGAPAGTP